MFKYRAALMNQNKWEDELNGSKEERKEEEAIGLLERVIYRF
jgi:hypothetical protein